VTTRRWSRDQNLLDLSFLCAKILEAASLRAQMSVFIGFLAGREAGSNMLYASATNVDLITTGAAYLINRKQIQFYDSAT